MVNKLHKFWVDAARNCKTQWKQADYVGAFYITLWFCQVGQILLVLGEKKKEKIVFENVMVCWHNSRPIVSKLAP